LGFLSGDSALAFEDKGHGWFNEAENLYEVLETIEEFVRFRKMEVRKNGN